MRRTLLFLGFTALVLSGSTGCKKKGPPPWKLPVDAKQLPPTTSNVTAEVVDGSREKDPRVKDLYMAAELGSEICREGTPDPARVLELMNILGTSTAKEFFKPQHIEEMRSLLECGSVFGANMDAPFQTSIEFIDDSGVKAEVDLVQLKVTELPLKYGLTKRAFGALDGYCRTSDPTKPNVTLDCTANSDAALRQDNTWFFGKRGELDRIAKTIATPKQELSTQVAALNDAANELEGLTSSHIESQLATAKPFLSAPCAWGAFQTAGRTSDFVQGCFPTSDDKAISEIDSKIRAAAFEIEPDVLKSNAVHGNIILVARDDDAGKIVEKDATDLAVDWKSQLENNEAKLVKQAKTNPISLRQKSWAIIVDNFSQAIQKIKVTRKGRVVKMSFSSELTPEDLRDLQEAQQNTLDDRTSVSDILAAIQKKQAVPVAALAKLVGAPWATYLVATSTWDPKNLPPQCAVAPPKTPVKKGTVVVVDPKCVAPVEPASALFGKK